jgi:hypothetical protein
MWSLPTNGGQSGRGQPHSKTLLRRIACHFFREVVECGSPMPLSLLPCAPAAPFTKSWSLEPPYVGCYESYKLSVLNRRRRHLRPRFQFLLDVSNYLLQPLSVLHEIFLHRFFSRSFGLRIMKNHHHVRLD